MVKTQRKKIKSNFEDESQPKRKPPEELRKLIELVNLLPANFILSSLDRVKSDNAHNYSDYNHSSRQNKSKKSFEIWTFDARWELAQKMKGLPKKYKKKFRQYIYGDSLPEADPLYELAITEKPLSEIWDSTRQAVERYEDFCRLRDQFDLITDFAMRHPSMLRELNNLKGKTAIVKKIQKQVRDRVFSDYKEHFDDSGFVKENEIKNLLLPFIGEVKFEIDSRGIIRPKASKIVEAIFFSEKNVEILRIRKCLICEKIFWAKGLNSFACDVECGSKLRESLKIKVVPTQKEKEEAAKRKREYNLMRKVRKLTKQYKDRVIKIQNSAYFDSTESYDSFKLAKGTTITSIRFESNEKNENHPIRCIIKSEEGQEGFFTLPNDKKTPYRIRLKLGTN